MSMKTLFRFAAVTAVLAYALTAGGAAHAAPETPVVDVDQNPFGDGTGTRRLDPQEKADLIQFAENSKALLKDALDRASGKGFDEANRIYLATIKKVVIASYAAKPRTELLLRYALNQALELTFGVPAADGRMDPKGGVLTGSANDELMTLVLEDSIRLAVSYYDDDRRAIDAGDLINLPYVRFASQRLSLAQKWLSSITEWKYMHSFSVAALQQWLNTVLNVDNMARAAYAEEIVKVNNGLDDLSAQPPTNTTELKQQVRFLRGLIKRVLESLRDKLQFTEDASLYPTPTVPAPTVPAPTPTNKDNDHDAPTTTGGIRAGNAVLYGTESSFGYGVITAVYSNGSVDVKPDGSSQEYNVSANQISPSVSCYKGVCGTPMESTIGNNPNKNYPGKVIAFFANGFVAMRDDDDHKVYVRSFDTLAFETRVSGIKKGDRAIGAGAYRGTVVAVYAHGNEIWAQIQDEQSRKAYVCPFSNIVLSTGSAGGLSKGDRVISNGKYRGTVVEVFANGRNIWVVVRDDDDGKEYVRKSSDVAKKVG